MARRRGINTKVSIKEAGAFDPESEHVKHTRVGVWDFYEDTSYKQRTMTPPLMRRLEDTLVSLPYVARAIKEVAILANGTLILYFACTLVASLLPAATLYYSSQLLHVVQVSIDSRSVDKSILFGVLFSRIICATLSHIGHYGQSWASLRIAAKMRSHYAESILCAHVRLDVPTYSDPAVRGQLETIVTARSNVAWTGIRTLTSSLSLLLQLLSQISILVAVLKNQPDGPLLALLSFADPMISWFRRSNVLYEGGTSFWAATCRNLDYIRLQGLKVLVDNEDYRKELVAANLEDHILSEFRAAQLRLGEDGDMPFHEAHNEKMRRQEMLSPFSFLSSPLQELPQLVFTLRAVRSPRSIPVSLASLTLIRQTVSSFVHPLLTLMQQTSTVSETFSSIRQLYEIVNIPNQVIDGTEPYPEDSSKVKTGIAIEFIDVSFRYPGTEGGTWAIKKVSFKIEAGQLCVLVGFNGSGKSTILKLLNRLYDPTEGSILIDGRDIKKLKLKDLRSCISTLFQDYTHFPLSIKENIGMGDPQHAHDEDRIRQAAELGGALDVITNLQDGFDTFLSRPVRDYYAGLPEGSRSLFGRVIDYGGVKKRVGRTRDIELSGGQMQKLAVSRTFMKSLGEDSKVGLLLFDEPSASLDPTAEHDLFERLRKLRGNKTMVFSSHRFGLLTKSADLVSLAYMADSSVVEAGSHDDLLNLKGGYSKMYNLQAAQFR
ncbi:P-loop containing nucleoside triphosphate hydrolase protein [Hysterangium stoloniferum]|nr:P-loop containing nucleoside triphosphate hydrolase protein [Hysterangium stoloniferum]